MTQRKTRAALFVMLLLLGWSRATAQGAPTLVENPLGEVPPDDPKMESYSHGNDLLYLVDALWGAGLLAIIVFSGFAATLQELAEKVSRSPNLVVAIYVVLFTAAIFVGGFPLTVYTGYLRERKYGFANQTFAAWLGDRGKGLLVTVVAGAIFLVILYAAMRRLGRR